MIATAVRCNVTRPSTIRYAEMMIALTKDP
jgi:hypothetical protein